MIYCDKNDREGTKSNGFGRPPDAFIIPHAGQVLYLMAMTGRQTLTESTYGEFIRAEKERILET